MPISNINTKLLCQQYLTGLYHNIQGHRISDRQKTISETYGEILYHSVDDLLSAVPLTEQDVFVDLGSGLGKVVIQIFLKSTVKTACGIEIIPELHEQALQAARTVAHDLPDFFMNGRNLQFHLGNFLEVPFTLASVVLIGSPCFSPSLLHPLGKIIDAIPGIHTVLSLRPISTLRRLTFNKVIQVQCSWDSALCYVYNDTKFHKFS